MAALFPNWKGIRKALKKAAKLLRPPPKLTPSQWAEAHVRIPAGNAVPGPINFDNAPYQREVLDLMFDPTCSRISLQWGAQVGKTQTALCGQAYAIVHEPRSQMMMQPSQGDLATWLETKWNPLADATPELRNRIAKPRGREGVNNRLMKSYPGGFLMFAWSGSPKTMRGRSAPMIVCDETDGYAVTDEGHPVSLLWQRAATFGDQRKLVEISTPTIKGASYIEKSFLAGDQRRFHVKCPHCEGEQTFKWSNVKWDGRRSTSDEDLVHIEEHDPTTARYACEHCGVLLNDGERIVAIRGGRWIAARPFKGHASFHLNEIYSTFRNLRDIVQSYLDKLQQDDLQTFYNVSLAETWEVAGESVEPNALKARAETYAAEVPEGAIYLTAGIDMQMDRLEVEVVGWGINEESWSIDHKILYGDPLGPEVWMELEEYLDTEWQHENGAKLKVQASCLDTGGTAGYTQAAYDYCRGKAGRRFFAIKGVGGWGRTLVSQAQRKQSGKTARKVDLYLVAVDEAKKLLMRRLLLTKPGPGYCHFPDYAHYDDEFYAQMTAEKLVTRRLKGFEKPEWHKTRDRNEALDCRIYAHAALKLLNPDLSKKAQKLAAAAKPAATTPSVASVASKLEPEVKKVVADVVSDMVEEQEPVAIQKTRRKLRRSSGSFATRY